MKISLKRGSQMMTNKRQRRKSSGSQRTPRVHLREHITSWSDSAWRFPKWCDLKCLGENRWSVPSRYSQAFLKSKYHINLKKKVLQVLLTGSERTQQYSSVPGYTGSSTPVFSQHRQGGDRGWGGWSTSSSSSTSSTSPPYSSLIRSWWWYWQGRRTWLAFVCPFLKKILNECYVFLDHKDDLSF